MTAQRAPSDAFTELAAWRPPEPRRFDPQPANDWRAEVERAARAGAEPEAPQVDWRAVVDWTVPVLGALAAAVIGASLGGWLQIL